jgi:hypothetical protein
VHGPLQIFEFDARLAFELLDEVAMPMQATLESGEGA